MKRPKLFKIKHGNTCISLAVSKYPDVINIFIDHRGVFQEWFPMEIKESKKFLKAITAFISYMEDNEK